MTKFLSNGGLEVLWTRIKNYVGTKLSDGSVTKVGTDTVGGTARGIYLNAGTPTACTANVGKSTQPIYLSGGTAKAVTTFVVGTQTAATNAWTGTIEGLTSYYDGLTIEYYLPFAGTSSAATLNINALGAKTVYNGRGRSSTTTHFPQYSIIRLTYYGGAWYAAAYYDSNSVYLSAQCWSSAATAAKTASASSYYPYAGNSMLLTINTANTYKGKLTLNVNSRGAKDLWINGKVSSADNCTLPAGTYPCYYDGTVWHLYTDGRIRHKAVYADTIHLINADGTTSSVATADDIDGILTAAATINGNALWNDGANLAMGGIVEWAGTQTSTVTVKNTSATNVAGIYLYSGKLIAKGTDDLWYANWQEAGRWGDTAEGGGWEPSKNVVYRLTGSNTLWRWSGTAMERLLIAADSATALSSSAGSATQPVYFSGGKPVAVTMQTTMHALCNALSLGDSNPQDNDYYICQYAGGGTSNTAYFRRKTSSLYAYMKGKMDALYAKASHTHSYLPLAGGTMTAAIKRHYGAASDDPMISLTTSEKDVWLWRISDNSSGTVQTSAAYGFGLKYIGTGTGNNNNLVLYADNQDGTQVAAMTVNQNGTTTFSGTVKATTFTGTLSGNATSATKLATARTINGTSFDGSGNITTAKWGTARAVKIGSTSKNVDGSAAVTWTLAEIGAAAASHNHDSSYAAKSHTHTIANVTNLQSTLDAKLQKTTYEVNTELQMASSGKVCLGKYTCRDTNITIEIRSTAADTYHGTLIIATQNIYASGDGTYTAKVYGDEDGALTPLIKIQRSGAVFAVYANLPTWSKNLIHVRCCQPEAAPTDIATSVTSIPTDATISPTNAFTHAHSGYATTSSVSSLSSTVSSHTTQLSELNLRTVQHSDKSIVCTTATTPDSQGRLVGKTGFYAGQAVYMGVQATYVFFAASSTTGTLVVYGQGVGTKGGGTMANQIMYSRTAANAWTKLG